MNIVKWISKSMLCISLLAILLGCASTPKGPSAESSAEDSLITSKVSSALFSEPSLRTSQIHVRTSNGVVKLTGVVEKSHDIGKAKEIAGSIPGVVDVQQELAIKE